MYHLSSLNESISNIFRKFILCFGAKKHNDTENTNIIVLPLNCVHNRAHSQGYDIIYIKNIAYKIWYMYI